MNRPGTDFLFVEGEKSPQAQQVVSRVKSIGGRGMALTGHHEIMIPLLAQAIVELDFLNHEQEGHMS